MNALTTTGAELEAGDISTKVLAERVALLRDGAIKALIANPVVFIFVVAAFWPKVTAMQVVIGALAHVAALLLRTRGYLQLRAASNSTDHESLAAQLRQYRIGVGAYGIVWAFTAFLFFVPGAADLQFFLLLIMSSLVVASLASVSSDGVSFALFAAPQIVAVELLLIREMAWLQAVCAVLVVVFSAFLFRGAREISKTITTNVRQREMLRRNAVSMGRYEFIVNAVPDAMSVIGHDHRYEAVNNSWCELMGLRREDVVGQHVSSIWGAETYDRHVKPALQRCFSGTPLAEHDSVAFPTVGSRECSITYYPYVEADGSVSHGVVVTRDVTVLEQAKRTAEGALDAAESASRAKSEFLASMSHELRTPLNAILGYAQLFASDEQLGAENRELAGEIQSAGEHLLALVNDLIDLARIEAGRLELSVETVAIEDAIAESMALVAPQARARQIVVSANYSGGDTAHAGGGDGADAGDGEGGDRRCTHVMADYVRLRQVLVNFLSNAIKYNQVGGKVEIVCRRVGDKARLEVIDNGPGIALDKQERLFNAFDRLGAEGGSVEGTGIGLVIAKRIIEAMGGAIGFASEPGHGSRFWVEMPLDHGFKDLGKDNEAQEMHMTPEHSADAGSRPAVLYIEDNPVNLKLMQHIFARRRDLVLHDAVDAERGIEIARELRPALILLDINLPGMDGYEALAILNKDERTASIPVVALTANAMKGDAERGRRAGFDGYLTKPINIDALFTLLQQTVASPAA